MGFLPVLLSTPTFLAGLASNVIIQKIEAYIPEILLILMTRQTTFHLDGYTVTAKLNAAPTAFTLSALVLAIEHILEGKLGTVTSGVIEIDILKAATLTPTAE